MRSPSSFAARATWLSIVLQVQDHRPADSRAPAPRSPDLTRSSPEMPMMRAFDSPCAGRSSAASPARSASGRRPTARGRRSEADLPEVLATVRREPADDENGVARGVGLRSRWRGRRRRASTELGALTRSRERTGDAHGHTASVSGGRCSRAGDGAPWSGRHATGPGRRSAGDEGPERGCEETEDDSCVEPNEPLRRSQGPESGTNTTSGDNSPNYFLGTISARPRKPPRPEDSAQFRSRRCTGRARRRSARRAPVRPCRGTARASQNRRRSFSLCETKNSVRPPASSSSMRR